MFDSLSGDIQQIIILAIGTLVSGVVAILLRKLNTIADNVIIDQTGTRVKGVIMNGVKIAASDGLVGQDAVDFAVGYAHARVPDAIANPKLKLSDHALSDLAKAADTTLAMSLPLIPELINSEVK